MSEQSAPLVSLSNVRKLYKQGTHRIAAVDGISLEITKGSFVVLAGASGSGKTTLLNLIGALDTPTDGQIQLGGLDVSAQSQSELAHTRLHKIGFVFQAYNLIPVLDTLENTEYVMLLQGVPKAERRQRALEMLRSVGLDGLERRRPAELSGGQQQRVAIARALAARPALVLADEPTANLDSSTSTALLQLMQALNQERGVTFIVAAHDPRVMDRAGRLIRIEDGRILSDEQRKPLSAA